MGGKTIYASTLGIVLGLVVMIIVLIYAIGKFSVIEGPQNVVTKTVSNQNDPYEIDLTNWDLHISILELNSDTYINSSNMF